MMENEQKLEFCYGHFGELLRSARRSSGLTQERLAERVGLNRSSVANIERGRQRVYLHTWLAIAEALSVPSVDLIPRERKTQPVALRVREEGHGEDIAGWAEEALRKAGGE